MLLSGISRALVVAAHPDDEVLGAGATIARWASEGVTVRTLILAEGITSRFGDKATDMGPQLGALRASAARAHKILGDELLPMGTLPDNRLDTVPLLEVVKDIEGAIEGFNPDCVLTHGPWDVNVDHKVTHEAVLAATRPQPGTAVSALAFFSVLSSTEWRFDPAHQFTPSLFVDVSGFEDRKAAALEAYGAEMRIKPHPRSIAVAQAQMTMWGSVVGVHAAEAFQVGRLCQKAAATVIHDSDEAQ